MNVDNVTPDFRGAFYIFKKFVILSIGVKPVPRVEGHRLRVIKNR